MRIILTRNTIVDGIPIAAGEIADVSKRDGQFLIEMQKAKPAESKQKPKSKRETAAVKPAETAAHPKPETMKAK